MNNILDIFDVEPEADAIPDTTWSPVKIKWAACDGATNDFMREFAGVLEFAGEETERMEAYARQQCAEWKTKANRG
jgi:hypothetical protein